MKSLSRKESATSQEFISMVDQHMLSLLDDYDGPIANSARTPIMAGGKRLRPLLVRVARPMIVEMDHSLEAAFDECALRGAAAVELIHTASLVHDDLLDNADIRRGLPTVSANDGRDHAVAVGDLLFSIAFKTLATCQMYTTENQTLRACRILARAARNLAEGEALQSLQERTPTITEDEYFTRCALKTGVLFSASLQIGAVLGGATQNDIDILGEFGERVGLAFQVADDILDCGTVEDDALIGKRTGADLRSGTITLPMLKAIRKNPSIAPKLTCAIPESKIADLLCEIHDAGGITHAKSTALEIKDDASKLLSQLEGRFDVEQLRRVADLAVDRLQ